MYGVPILLHFAEPGGGGGAEQGSSSSYSPSSSSDDPGVICLPALLGLGGCQVKSNNICIGPVTHRFGHKNKKESYSASLAGVTKTTSTPGLGVPRSLSRSQSQKNHPVLVHAGLRRRSDQETAGFDCFLRGTTAFFLQSRRLTT